MPKIKTNAPKVKLYKVSSIFSDFYFRSIADATKLAVILQKAVRVRTHWLDDDPEWPDSDSHDYYEYTCPEDDEIGVTIKTTHIEKSKRLPPPKKGLPAPKPLGLPAPK